MNKKKIAKPFDEEKLLNIIKSSVQLQLLDIQCDGW